MDRLGPRIIRNGLSALGFRRSGPRAAAEANGGTEAGGIRGKCEGSISTGVTGSTVRFGGRGDSNLTGMGHPENLFAPEPPAGLGRGWGADRSRALRSG